MVARVVVAQGDDDEQHAEDGQDDRRNGGHIVRCMSTTAPRDAPTSAWAPLRIPLFRALLIAQFASNIGTWMQTVGAQWLMGDLTHDPLRVALVQTATSLPVFLFGFPAGALGDIF